LLYKGLTHELALSFSGTYDSPKWISLLSTNQPLLSVEFSQKKFSEFTCKAPQNQELERFSLVAKRNSDDNIIAVGTMTLQINSFKMPTNSVAL